MIVAKMPQQDGKRPSNLLSLVVILQYPPGCPSFYLVAHAIVNLDVCILTLSLYFFYSCMHFHILLIVTTNSLLYLGSQCHILLVKRRDHLVLFSLLGCTRTTFAFISYVYTLYIIILHNLYYLYFSLDVVSSL